MANFKMKPEKHEWFSIFICFTNSNICLYKSGTPLFLLEQNGSQLALILLQRQQLSYHSVAGVRMGWRLAVQTADLWQTGREGASSLAERVGSLGGGSGGVKRDPGLNRRGENKRVKKWRQKCEKRQMKRRESQQKPNWIQHLPSAILHSVFILAVKA